MKNLPWKWRGQGHVSNFYIVDLENFTTASRRYTLYRWYTQLDRRRIVYDAYKTVKATRMHHCWVHMFITHRPILTLQLYNFDLFRTCRTSSFCTVAWQLSRFQLTRRIARSLGDSWVSCTYSVGSTIHTAYNGMDWTEVNWYTITVLTPVIFPNWTENEWKLPS